MVNPNKFGVQERGKRLAAKTAAAAIRKISETQKNGQLSSQSSSCLSSSESDSSSESSASSSSSSPVTISSDSEVSEDSRHRMQDKKGEKSVPPSTPKRRTKIKSEDKETKQKFILPIPMEIRRSIQILLNSKFSSQGMPLALLEEEFRSTYSDLDTFDPVNFGFEGWEGMMKSVQMRSTATLGRVNGTMRVKGLPLISNQATIEVDEKTGICSIVIKSRNNRNVS